MSLKTRYPNWLDNRLLLLTRAKPFDRLVLHIIIITCIVLTIASALALNSRYAADTPITGGIVTEGIVGVPRFVNPVLAITRADQDITTLMFRGLMKIDPSGNLVPDLAESVMINENGVDYTVVVRRDVRFHDGTPLSARDVAYTMQLAQDPDLKSPLRGNWSNVTISEIDEYTLTITLSEPYAPFIENFTIGILPAHLWSNLTIEEIPFSQLNTEPVGTGPFRLANTSRNSAGQVTEYRFTQNPNATVPPRLHTIVTKFYPNEDELREDLQNGEITSTAYLLPNTNSPIPNDSTIIAVPLPRLFTIFFNENRNQALQDTAARQALALVIDREDLIQTALNGHGIPISQPVFFSTSTLEYLYGIADYSTSTPAEIAQAHLRAGGWSRTGSGPWRKTIDGSAVDLQITLKTGNSELFSQTAASVLRAWQEIGVPVTLEQYDQTSLVQSVIRPRDFEGLLFGIDLNRSEDLYPFWHSSQKDDPGLNVAQYTNLQVDDLLTEARNTQVDSARQALLKAASDTIARETPAILLFQPTFAYVIAPNTELPTISRVSRPSDRFMNVAVWHNNRAALWPWFRNDI